MKIRFAPLIRVSTESQAKQGESLRTQKKQIIQYVKNLNGDIPESCWRYSGQESATEGHERQKLEQLLEDSSKNLFDAVIVCDASRWSRDNEKSKAGLKIFKKNGIRFFAGSSEFDLFNPQASLFLGMSTEMNEFFALEQTKKSLENKIERTKRGIPASGDLPYGRTFDKVKNEWGIDKEKQKNIKWAARRYLEGQSMRKLSSTIGVSIATLWRVIKERAGDKWEIRFRSKKLGIDQAIEMKIPRLLPQATIDQIHKKIQANKTYTHGPLKHRYLLARVVFCSQCGYAMSGQTTNEGKYQYYRHARYRKEECPDIGFIMPASSLEDAVMFHLFKTYGDIESMEKSMLRAIPDNSKIEILRDQKQAFEKDLEKAEAELQRLIKSIAKGLISDDEAEKAVAGIRERETLLKDEISKILPQVENVPTKDQIKRRAKLIKRQLEAVYFRPGRLKKMSFDQKRKVVQTAFGGKDSAGFRYGVYLTKPSEEGKPIVYEIQGVFADIKGQLPMSEKEKEMVKQGLIGQHR